MWTSEKSARAIPSNLKESNDTFGDRDEHAHFCLHVRVFMVRVSPGEGKRRNEFAEWHVAWLAE